jgi:hypothetical protein
MAVGIENLPGERRTPPRKTWALPGVSVYWTGFVDHGQIIGDENKGIFFDTPRSERAKQFLARILQY